MNNKPRRTTCLNCTYSYRNEERILTCHKHLMTSVTQYDCPSYEVFIDDKEDLVRLYKALKLADTKKEA